MSDARDDLREAIENAVAHQIPFRLIDHPLMVGFTQRATDAVLEVVRGVDADQYEQVEAFEVYTAEDGERSIRPTPGPLYRRVVPVVPSPDRCPTCGSDDRTKRGFWQTGSCRDPWHRVPSTEPKEG